VLKTDWERLRSAYPGLDDERLADGALARSREILAELPTDPPSTASVQVRLDWLSRWFPRKAASIAVQGLDLVDHIKWQAVAQEMEQRTYERHLELDKDIVPPLKEEAKALRAEVRRLEEQVRAKGVDPDSIEPRIDWSRTLAVDIYKRPRYESNESRKRTTVEFFKRLGRD
jgi:hypothetical protein